MKYSYKVSDEEEWIELTQDQFLEIKGMPALMQADTRSKSVLTSVSLDYQRDDETTCLVELRVHQQPVLYVCCNSTNDSIMAIFYSSDYLSEATVESLRRFASQYNLVFALPVSPNELAKDTKGHFYLKSKLKPNTTLLGSLSIREYDFVEQLPDHLTVQGTLNNVESLMVSKFPDYLTVTEDLSLARVPEKVIPGSHLVVGKTLTLSDHMPNSVECQNLHIKLSQAHVLPNLKQFKVKEDLTIENSESRILQALYGLDVPYSLFLRNNPWVNKSFAHVSTDKWLYLTNNGIASIGPIRCRKLMVNDESSLTELREGCVVVEDAFFVNCLALKLLPNNLVIGGDLTLTKTGITKLPPNGIVFGNIKHDSDLEVPPGFCCFGSIEKL